LFRGQTDLKFPGATAEALRNSSWLKPEILKLSQVGKGGLIPLQQAGTSEPLGFGAKVKVGAKGDG
jgi:hypothetical protein